MLTADQLRYLHDHLGASADEDDLQERYTRLGDLGLVVVEVLQRRLADLAATPAQFSVSGEYSQNTAENIKLLTSKLADFAAGDTVGGMSVVRVARAASQPCR